MADTRAASLHRKGLALNRQGRHEEALACFSEAIRLNPKDNTAWHRKGIELNALGKYDEAIVCFDKAIGINQKDHFAWNHKAVALRELGKYQEALSCCNEAIRLSERYPFAWYNRGAILRQLGSHAGAEASLKRAAELDPKRFLSPATTTIPSFVQNIGESTTDQFIDKLDKWLGKRTMLLCVICVVVGFVGAVLAWLILVQQKYAHVYWNRGDSYPPFIAAVCITLIGIALLLTRLWLDRRIENDRIEQEKAEIIDMIDDALRTKGGDEK
jgi:tetratricopeptide (TPR) repeat protein